jgi:hypothetical protein
VAQLVAIGKTFESLTDGRITYFWGVTVPRWLRAYEELTQDGGMDA